MKSFQDCGKMILFFNSSGDFTFAGKDDLMDFWELDPIMA